MRIYLDFDGVMHHYNEEYYQEMHKMEVCRKQRVDYFEQYGTQFLKQIKNARIFWMPHFFENARLLRVILEEFSEKFPIEIYVHSNWRGWGNEIIKAILAEFHLDKWFKGILPFEFNSDSRFINILYHLQQVPTKHWIVIDDYEDLFMSVSENHFVKCESAIGLDNDSDAMHKLISLLQKHNETIK